MSKITFVQDPDAGIVYKQGDPESFLKAIYTQITKLEDQLELVRDHIKFIKMDLRNISLAIMNFENEGEDHAEK